MFKLLRKLLLLALLSVALVVGAKFYLEEHLSKQLDRKIAAAAPVASISYQKLYIDRDLGLNIVGLSVDPIAAPVGRSWVSSIRLSSSDRFMLARMAFEQFGESWPDAMTVELKGVDLGLLSSQFLQDAISHANQAFASKHEPACGEVQYLSSVDWQAMGINNLSFNLNLQYHYIDAQRALKVLGDSDVEGMGRVQVAVLLGDMPALSMQTLSRKTLPVLRQLEINYLDRGYVSAMTEYCGKKLGGDKNTFIERELSRDDRYFLDTWGVIPGAALKASYRDFLSDPKSVSFSMFPAEDFQFEQLSLYQPKDWPGLLKMTLLVNDQAVSPLLFSLDAVDSSDSMMPESSFPVEAEAAELTPVGPHYQEVSKKELPKYRGYKIRVTSVNGRHREGVFKQIRDGNIEMESEKYGGRVGLSVSVFSAVKIEVLK